MLLNRTLSRNFETNAFLIFQWILYVSRIWGKIVIKQQKRENAYWDNKSYKYFINWIYKSIYQQKITYNSVQKPKNAKLDSFKKDIFNYFWQHFFCSFWVCFFKTMLLLGARVLDFISFSAIFSNRFLRKKFNLT